MEANKRVNRNELQPLGVESMCIDRLTNEAAGILQQTTDPQTDYE